MTTINSQFSVTGGETQRAPNNAFLPGERKISILPAPFTGVPSPAQ